MGNPGAQMGVDWLLLRGFPALPRCQSQTRGRNMISTSAFPLACSHYASSGMTRTPYVPPPKAHSLQGYTTLEKKDIIPLHEWLSTQKAERIVPQRTVCLLSQNWELGASDTLQVRGSRSCSTSWKCPGRPLFPDPNNEWSGSNVPSAEDEAGRLHSTQLHWNPSTVWLCSSSQLYFYQWEASRGLFINCVRKCLMYSPESSRAE